MTSGDRSTYKTGTRRCGGEDVLLSDPREGPRVPPPVSISPRASLRGSRSLPSRESHGVVPGREVRGNG